MAEFDREEIKKVIKKYGSDLIAEIRKLLKKEDSVASGDLLNSFRWEAVSAAKNLEYHLKSEDYFRYVNEGRPPGEMPPVSKIRKWTQQKGLPKEAAFPIAKNIGKFGIEGHKILSRALKEVNRGFEKKLKDTYEKEIIDFINEFSERTEQ